MITCEKKTMTKFGSAMNINESKDSLDFVKTKCGVAMI